MLTVALKSLNAAQQRYQAGVGNILELLNAQSAVADAAKRRIHALTDWRNERLQLSGKLGRLDMHDVDMQ
jgi:outer membrane protein